MNEDAITMLQLGYAAISNRLKNVRNTDIAKSSYNFDNNKRKRKAQRVSRRNNKKRH